MQRAVFASEGSELLYLHVRQIALRFRYRSAADPVQNKFAKELVYGVELESFPRSLTSPMAFNSAMVRL